MRRDWNHFRSAEAEARFHAEYDSVLKLWPVPFREADVPTTHGKTHVIIAGAEGAPPLVLLHGSHATSTMWWNVVGELSAHHCCYCVDVMGDAGKSVTNRPFRSFGEHVQWLGQVLDQLGIRQTALMGMSNGGAVAANFALCAPDRVSRLVLLCPAATLAPFSISFLLQALPVLVFKSEWIIRRSLGASFYNKENLSDPVTRLAVMAFQSYVQKGAIFPPVLSDEELRRITVPTTVLVGDHETIYRSGPAAALKRAEDLIPGVRTHLIERAGHILLVDNPEAVRRLILEALA